MDNINNLPKDTIFIALDGDSIGNQVAGNFLNDSVEGVQEVGERINLGQDLIMKWAQDHGGMVISWGGDESSFEVPQAAMEDLEQLRSDYEFCVGATCSIGIGKKLSEAAKALLVAKFRGKNQIVTYDQSVESDFAISEGISEEKAPVEDTQVNMKSESEPNMENSDLTDCKYCNNVEDSDCKYCDENDANQQERGSPIADDCQYCNQSSSNEEQPPGEPGASDHCEYCHDTQADNCQYCSEDSNNPQNNAAPFDPNGNSNAAPDQEVEGIDDTGSLDSNGITPDVEANAVPDQNDYADNQEQDPNKEGELHPEPTQEAVDQIQGQIDNDEAGEGNETTRDVLSHIDDTDLAVGTNMEDNISRPEGYEEDVPSDLGLSEDEDPNDSPDLSEVLKDGLDEHADNIQREKAVQMVGEALEGFKASKPVLEKAKEQAPELYNACLSILKAMIEMSKMMGLGAEVPDQSSQEQEDSPEEENEWDDSFPLHEDHGGEAKEDAPKEDKVKNIDYENPFPKHVPNEDQGASQGGAAIPKP